MSLQYFFRYATNKLIQLLKKGEIILKKKAEKASKGTETAENLKYEIGQEMGISPKTKNKKS